MLIVMDEVLNKTITELRFVYEEPLVLVENTPQTTRSTVTPKGWEQQETGGEELVAVLLIEDSDSHGRIVVH